MKQRKGNTCKRGMRKEGGHEGLGCESNLSKDLNDVWEPGGKTTLRRKFYSGRWKCKTSEVEGEPMTLMSADK